MATFSVDGAGGLITLTGDDSGEQDLASLSERYIEVTFSLDWAITGSGTASAQALYRVAGGAYYSVDYTIDLDADELTSITLTDTGSPIATATVNIPHGSDPIQTRIMSTDRQQIRVWSSADPEPSTWDIDEVEDGLPSGTFGFVGVADTLAPAPSAITLDWTAGFEISSFGTLSGTPSSPTTLRYFTTAVGTTFTTDGSGYDGIGNAARVVAAASNAGFSIDASRYSTATRTRAVMSFRFLFEGAVPTTDCDIWHILCNGSNTSETSLTFRNSDSKLLLDGTEGPVVVADTWYKVDLNIVNQGSSSTTVDWRVNNVSQTQVINTDPGGAVSKDILFVWFGPVNGGATTVSMLFDDCVTQFGGVSALTSYPFPDIRIVRLDPDVNGTITQSSTANAQCRFTANGGGLDATFNSADILAAISEFPWVGGASSSGIYTRIADTSENSRVLIPMETYTLVTGETITGLRAFTVTWGNQAAFDSATAQWLATVDGGSTTTALYQNANGSYRNVDSPGVMCAPYTPSGGWDQAKLDAFQFAWSATDNAPEPGSHAMYAELAIASNDGTMQFQFDDLEIFACVNEA